MNTTPVDEFRQILDQIRAMPCRCCMGTTLRPYVQPPITPKGRATLYVDCRNPQCALYTVTREFTAWLSFDLASWGAVEHPDFARAIAEASGGPASIRTLVESLIVEREAPLASLVLRDFQEQLAQQLPYRRHAFCAQWLRMYTGVPA